MTMMMMTRMTKQHPKLLIRRKIVQLIMPMLPLLVAMTTTVTTTAAAAAAASDEKILVESFHNQNEISYTEVLDVESTAQSSSLDNQQEQEPDEPEQEPEDQDHRFLQTSTPAPTTLAPTPAPTNSTIDWEYENIVALRWKIENPPVISYSGLQFNMDFTVSDYITGSLVRYELYQGSSCGYFGDLITDSGYMTVTVVPDSTPVGGGLATRVMTLENYLVPENITNSNSYVESGTDATITYCIRFELWDGVESDPNATQINHQDVTVSLALDLSDEFSITAQNVVARDRIVETSDDEFFVEGFICDPATGLPPQDVVPILQGQTVRVCVKPTPQALAVGFKMRRIDNFNFIQGYTTQEAVSDGSAASNGLTRLECDPGSTQCHFDTLLFAYFFTAAISSIGGSGSASLQWVESSPSRQLEQASTSSTTDYVRNVKSITDNQHHHDMHYQHHQDRRQLQTTKRFSVEIFSVEPILRDSQESSTASNAPNTVPYWGTVIGMVFGLLFSIFSSDVG
mmetsp:Transcript_35371/g.85603  ORF Transcript_35371/g.85603 Transcript_35371/m.85603 type:complete len:513 (+) Transcript_35371:653-2191(+)